MLLSPTLRVFLRKELTQALRDVRMRILIFGVPLIQLTIFGLALSTEIRNIRLAIRGDPSDVMFQRLAERAYASGWFIPATDDGREASELIQSRKADAVLIAPPRGLTRSMKRADGRVQLLIDASNAIRARSIEVYAQAILQEVAVEQSRQPATRPIQFSVRMLYNPSMDSAVYLVPGVMGMLLSLITIILTSMSMAREKELGTFETLIAAPISKTEILLGKTLPFVILGLIDIPIVIGVAMLFFGVPLRGPVWMLAFASLIFICTTVSVGTVISTFSKNQQQAMMGGFLFLFPAIQLSGVMVPIENIPFVFKIIAAFNPLQYFVSLLRNIMLKGGNPWLVFQNLGALVLLAVLAMTICARRFHRTLN